MTDPFLPYKDDTDPPGRDFVGMYDGTLNAADAEQAKLLLQVASDRIRTLALAVNLIVDTNAAQQVVFEVVRDAVTYGGLERLSQFENRTLHRLEAGTFDEAAKVVDDYLTNKHKRLLGLAVLAGPRGSFKKCDY